MPSRHGSRFFHHESPRAFGRAPGVPHRPADAFWHHLDVHCFVVAGGKAGHRSYGGSAARRPYCAGIAAKIKPAEKPTADDTDLKSGTGISFLLSPVILLRPLDVVSKSLCGYERPIRIAQELARKNRHICLAGADDLVGLSGI